MTPQETAAQTADLEVTRRDNVALASKLLDAFADAKELAHGSTDHTEYAKWIQAAMTHRALLLELVNELSR